MPRCLRARTQIGLVEEVKTQGRVDTERNHEHQSRTVVDRPRPERERERRMIRFELRSEHGNRQADRNATEQVGEGKVERHGPGFVLGPDVTCDDAVQRVGQCGQAGESHRDVGDLPLWSYHQHDPGESDLNRQPTAHPDGFTEQQGRQHGDEDRCGKRNGDHIGKGH